MPSCPGSSAVAVEPIAGWSTKAYKRRYFPSLDVTHITRYTSQRVSEPTRQVSGVIDTLSMPALRIDKASFSYDPEKTKITMKTMRRPTSTAVPIVDVLRPNSEMDLEIYFPVETSEREAFRTKNGKACELEPLNNALCLSKITADSHLPPMECL